MENEHLARIIAAYGSDILRFCRITAGSRAEGDELYQDTMLILLEKQHNLDGSQNVKSYAISAAVKLWKNRQRKIARRLRLVPQESLEELTQRGIQPGETASPEEALLQKSQAEILREMIRQLPEKYRLPLQLHYSADLPVKEIAKLMKLPESTVKTRLRRAKEQLRQKLEELDYDRTAI